jgi:hypothetical protein
MSYFILFICILLYLNVDKFNGVLKMNTIMLRFFAVCFLLMICSCYASVEEADCFQYYKFQNGLLFDDLHSDKYLHSVGEDAIFSYNLVNNMGSPVVQGKVRFQIFYQDAKEGEQIIDESIAYQNINLMPGDIMAQDFRWLVPISAKPGKYSLKVYFLSGESFNLAGLSFNPYGPPGVPGAMTSFEVANPMPGYRIYFSKEATYVNKIKYPFTSFLSGRSEPIELKTILVNEGPDNNVHLSMSVYEWDDVSEKPMPGYSMEKDVQISADASIDISYSLPKLDPGTYNVRFVATGNNGKSVMKIRLPISGAKGRLGYMGVDRFPLMKGEPALLFFCLSNSADYRTSFNGTGAIELIDSEGTILKESYDMEVTPAPLGRKLRFTPGRDVTNATLKITLYDASGKLMDEEILAYDYSSFQKVPAKLKLAMDKKQYSLGEKIPYSITYSDQNDRPLLGRILLYVIDSKGKVVSLLKSREVSGSFHGLLEIPSEVGEYGFIIREISRDLKAETSFAVLNSAQETNASTSTTVQETIPVTIPATMPEPLEEGPKVTGPDWLYPAVGVLAVVLIIIVIVRRKKK